MSNRPDKDHYFLNIAEAVSMRATCLRHKFGAVAVYDGHIISTGYNGSPSGMPDCLTLGCLRDELNIPSGTKHELCRAIHAEANAVIQAALHGVSTRGSTIYCNGIPCIICAKMLVNAKIVRFVASNEDYPDKSGVVLLKSAGVEVQILA